MQPQIDRYLRLARARFAKGGVAGGGYKGGGSVDDQIRVSQWMERNKFPADWGSNGQQQGIGGIDFPPANESTDWNYGTGNSGFYFGPHGGPSLYPTYYTNQGNLGWLPHGQRYGFGGSGAGYATGGYSPLAGAGVGTPGMGGSLMPGAMNSSYDIPKQIHGYNRGGVAQEQDDRTPAWFIEKIGGELMTPDELDRRWQDWQYANEQARKRAMNEKPYSRGGMVGPAKQPLHGYGRDTVPAALTPGEAVFNRKQLGAIQPRPGHANRLRPDQIMAMAKAGRGRNPQGR